MRTTHWVDGEQQARGYASEIWRAWMGAGTPEQFLASIAEHQMARDPGALVDAEISGAVLRHLAPLVDYRHSEAELAICNAILDARDRALHACAYCGACIGDSPASDDLAAWPERNPPVADDAAWARIAAAHRPGCEWAATRAHRVTAGWRASATVAPLGDEALRDDPGPVEKLDSVRYGAVRAILAADPGHSANLRRFDRGLMPEDEQRERLLDAALAPLSHWGGFVRLLRGDVPHGPPCRQPLMWPFSDGACTFAEDTAPRLTAAEFAALEGIESALARKSDDPAPWAVTVAPFALVATCTVCGAARSRVGIAATVVAGDWTQERRYAAEVPPGWQKEG